MSLDPVDDAVVEVQTNLTLGMAPEEALDQASAVTQVDRKVLEDAYAKKYGFTPSGLFAVLTVYTEAGLGDIPLPRHKELLADLVDWARSLTLTPLQVSCVGAPFMHEGVGYLYCSGVDNPGPFKKPGVWAVRVSDGKRCVLPLSILPEIYPTIIKFGSIQ